MTGPVTTEALDYVRDLIRQSVETGAPGVHRHVREAIVRSIFLKIDGKVIQPLLSDKAAAEAALPQVTAERDEARKEASDLQNDWADEVAASRQETERADAAEASLATATSELARLRAEGAAKDRALKVALDAYDAAVRESANAEAVRQDVLGRQGDHPDIGEIMDQVGAEEGCMRAMAARGIARADLVAAVRTALTRSATAREG